MNGVFTFNIRVIINQNYKVHFHLIEPRELGGTAEAVFILTNLNLLLLKDIFSLKKHITTTLDFFTSSVTYNLKYILSTKSLTLVQVN